MNPTQTIQTAEPLYTSIQPVNQKERIILLDMIRGVAICGILIMNIPFFGRSINALDPRVMHELSSTLNMKTWFVVDFLLEGSMRGLFSMLFGAGAVLLISRLEKAHDGLKPADIYVRRLIWLLVFGLINGYVFNWMGDILYHYAIVGLFLFPFRNASNKILIGLIIFFVSITMLRFYLKTEDMNETRNKGIVAVQMEKEKRVLNEGQKEDLEKWNGMQEEMKTENKRKKADKDHKTVSTGSYAKVWGYTSKLTTWLETTKFHGFFFFDIIIFMLLGILLFKTGIITGQKSELFYWALMIGGYIIGLGLGYMEKTAVYTSGFDPFRYQEKAVFPINMYQIHRIGTTMGHMSLVILMWKNGFFKWILNPLSKMGQMAFTNYLMQSIICGFVFYGYGFGYFGKLQRYELYYVVAGIWIFEMIFSVIWLKYFRFGPLEWLWRSLTYWEKQPMKKKEIASTE